MIRKMDITDLFISFVRSVRAGEYHSLVVFEIYAGSVHMCELCHLNLQGVILIIEVLNTR